MRVGRMIFKEGLSSILTVMPISTAADVEGQPNLPSRPQTSQPRQTAFRTIPFPAPLFILRSHRAKILKVKKGIKNEMLTSGGIVKTYRFMVARGWVEIKFPDPGPLVRDSSWKEWQTTKHRLCGCDGISLIEKSRSSGQRHG